MHPFCSSVHNANRSPETSASSNAIHLARPIICGHSLADGEDCGCDGRSCRSSHGWGFGIGSNTISTLSGICVSHLPLVVAIESASRSGACKHRSGGHIGWSPSWEARAVLQIRHAWEGVRHEERAVQEGRGGPQAEPGTSFCAAAQSKR
jgi:hypothetical protein